MYREDLSDTIGGRRLDQIDRKTIMDILVDMRRNGLSRSTIDLARGCISGPIQFAIGQDVIQNDPTVGIMKLLRMS